MNKLFHDSLSFSPSFFIDIFQLFLVSAKMGYSIHYLQYPRLLQSPENILFRHRRLLDNVIDREAPILVESQVVDQPLRPPGQIGLSPQI